MFILIYKCNYNIATAMSLRCTKKEPLGGVMLGGSIIFSLSAFYSGLIGTVIC